MRAKKQHAKWTAKRIRRGLLGQSLLDFSTASWSSIQLKDSAFCPTSQEKREQPKKTPRILRSFALSRVVHERIHKHVGMDAGTAEHTGSLSVSTDVANKKVSLSFSKGAATSEKPSQESDAESVASETEESDKIFK